MEHSNIAEFKEHQRAMWASFAPSAIFTTPVAAHLVAFAGVQAGMKILDVGTGTGVVAITAARHGAHVTGLDLTPELLEQAKEDAAIAGQTDIEWLEGDAEALPYADNSFDLVLVSLDICLLPDLKSWSKRLNVCYVKEDVLLWLAGHQNI